MGGDGGEEVKDKGTIWVLLRHRTGDKSIRFPEGELLFRDIEESGFGYH